MRPRLTLLLIVIVTALLGLGAPSCCPTGMIYDGDECVCKPGHLPDDDQKGCHLPDISPETTTTTTVPSPVPTPNPSPATPEPPPSPPIACILPAMPACNAPGPEGGPWGCCTREGREDNYLEAVQEAVAFVRSDKPSLFDGDRILNIDAYRMAVVSYLRLHGYCAAMGPTFDEVAVKQTNEFNEQYDIVIGDDRIGAFQAVVCKPARF